MRASIVAMGAWKVEEVEVAMPTANTRPVTFSGPSGSDGAAVARQ